MREKRVKERVRNGLFVWIFLISLIGSQQPHQLFNIVDYGAVGDGHTLNTIAVMKAIAAASESGEEGGIVYVPEGVFIVGQFSLASNVYLQISSKGQIYASDDPTQYKCIPSLTSDTGPCDYPFIYAINTTNIGLLGPGIINGGANDPPGHLVKYYNQSTNFLTPIDWSFSGCTSYGSCRPKLVVITNCVHVIMDGIQLLNSPLWTTTIVQSKDIFVNGVFISGDRRWPNNDGFDPVDSSDIIIQNSVISTGDDCICVVTHTPYPCHNITVRNSTLSSTSAAFKITTNEADASGDIYDINLYNIEITGTNRGIAIMPRWGSGNIYNIAFENITMETMYFSDPWWGSAEPIYVTSANMSTSRLWTGYTNNITFTNITAISENGIVVKSFGHPISNLIFNEVNIIISQFTNFSRPGHDWRPTLEPQMVYAPTNGFYVDTVDGLVLNNSSFTFLKPIQPFWGVCLNVSDTTNFVKNDIICNNN